MSAPIVCLDHEFDFARKSNFRDDMFKFGSDVDIFGKENQRPPPSVTILREAHDRYRHPRK